MSSFTIGKKLFVGSGALVVLTFALGIAGYVGIANLGDWMHTMIFSTIKKQSLGARIALDSSVLLADLRELEVRGFLKDAAGMEKCHSDAATTADELLADINVILPMIAVPSAKQNIEDIRDTSTQIRAGEQAVYKAALAGDMDASIAAYTVLVPVQERQRVSTVNFLKVEDGLVAADSVGAISSVDSSRWITLGLLALSCVVGVVVIFVVRQINALLRDTVLELGESAVQIASAANQVASSSQSLAQGSSEQAATIEETSSVSAEINSMAQRATESSRATVEMMTASEASVGKTNQSMTEMVGAMEGINASSQKISKIIKVIDEIAFQTNILALNAAVEAARAGEAGMGFAVVADEVRNLAQRCAQAAKDTADLIEESIVRSNGGRVKVDEVAVAIHAITAETAKIKLAFEEINLGSVEQSHGIDQIGKAITQMEQVTQSSAASAEEGAAAAEQLNAQAEAMTEIVNRLKTMVDGAGTASVTKDAPITLRQRSDTKLSAPSPRKLETSRPKVVASFKSSVKFTPAKSVPVARKAAVATSAAEFPMDGDFKEF
jgi:methyl-accepting chemotaxis protein